jgi:hypothetical protein
MTVKKHLIENESKGQWLEAAPGEHFLIRVPGSETNNSYSVTEFSPTRAAALRFIFTRGRMNTCWWWKERCECCMEKGRSTPRQVL